MSGFALLLKHDGAQVLQPELDALQRALRGRGPDGADSLAIGSVGMVHTQFLTSEEEGFQAQPASLDGRVWLVGEARLDGRSELFERLGLARDMRLCETADATLILHAYHRWGDCCLEVLRGDFSFAIWDGRDRRLLAARDQFGMRQLYYRESAGALLISNVFSCLRDWPRQTNALNGPALTDFLLFGDINACSKTHTAFEAITALAPAHRLSFAGRQARQHRYWHFPLDQDVRLYSSEAELLEHFVSVLDRAVADRLPASDVALALSGGMDSSSIAASVVNQGSGRSPRVHALSYCYGGLTGSQERVFASQVADHLHLPLEFLDASDYPLPGPPVAMSRPLELYQPALFLEAERRAASAARVRLVGEGGDNLLAFSSRGVLARVGMRTYMREAWRLSRLYGRVPGPGSGRLARWKQRPGAGGVVGGLSTLLPAWLLLPPGEREKVLHVFQAPADVGSEPLHLRHPRIHNGLLLESWSPDDLFLSPGFTPAETRDPFLDLRLLEFVLSLQRLPWLYNKHILRAAMATRLPASIRRRPKTPLGPIHQWLLPAGAVLPAHLHSLDPRLSEFVDERVWRQALLTGSSADQRYVNLRPMLLSEWLRAL